MIVLKEENIASLKIGVFILLIIIFFSNGFQIFYNRWFWAGSYYSHGPLVVAAFILLLIYRVKDFKPALDKHSLDLSGLILIIISLVIYLFGLWKHIPSFAMWGILIFVVGNSVLFFSKNFVIKNIGIYIYLLLAVPIPEVIINLLTFELNLFASYMSEVFISLIYPSTIRNGNILQVDGYSISITYECSGLSNLLSMFSVVWLMALFQSKKNIAVIDYLVSIPAAIISNILRIIIVTVLVINGYEQFALYTWHSEIGIFVFIIIVIFIAIFNELPLGRKSFSFKFSLSRLTAYLNNKLINVYIIVMVLLCLLSFIIQHKYDLNNSGNETLLKDKIPEYIGGWQSSDKMLGEDYFIALGTKDLVMRTYLEKGKNTEKDKVYLYIIRSKNNVSAFHRPELCLRGEGYELLTHNEIDLETKNKKTITVHRQLFLDRDEGLLVYYWYHINGINIKDTIEYKLLFLFNLNENSSGNFIRISKPVDLNNITQEEEKMKKFAHDVIPDILEYL